ncbi:arylamine N-acetyltransferase family protein [Nocardia sp. NPDC003482]
MTSPATAFARDEWCAEDLDPAVYARRLGLERTWPTAPTDDALHAVHRAHAVAIPFDNLDFVTGVPVSLDPGAVTAKLCGPRGGCCHEHNLLLGWALEQLGFEVERLAARVLFGGTGPRPRTHMLLRVRRANTVWLCDVGFGTHGFLDPLPFADGVIARQDEHTFRVRAHTGALWAVEVHHERGWTPLYEFTLDPLQPPDVVVAHHFLATHPNSMLRKTPLLQRIGPGRRIQLRGRELTERRGADRRTRGVTPASLTDDLAAFGIRLSADQHADLVDHLFATP